MRIYQVLYVIFNSAKYFIKTKVSQRNWITVTFDNHHDLYIFLGDGIILFDRNSITWLLYIQELIGIHLTLKSACLQDYSITSLPKKLFDNIFCCFSVNWTCSIFSISSYSLNFHTHVIWQFSDLTGKMLLTKSNLPMNANEKGLFISVYMHITWNSLPNFRKSDISICCIIIYMVIYI